LVLTDSREFLWFPPNELCDEKRVNDLVAVGSLLRLAIRIGQPIATLLQPGFFAVLKGVKKTMDNLRVIRHETANGIDSARNIYELDDDAGLCFDDGRDITRESFDEYVSAQIQLWLETQIATSVDAVTKGFARGGKDKWMGEWASSELHRGVTAPRIVDWTSMKLTSRLKGYSTEDQTVVSFWDAVDSLEEDQKHAFLKFTTGSEYPSALGFERHPISIQEIFWSASLHRSPPRSHTCFLMLDLPDVSDKSIMQEIIQLCIDYKDGFGNP
jgi:hypothetical protein